MTIYKMSQMPLQNGYSVDHAYNKIRQQVAGGSRYRVDKRGMPHTVQVNWTTDRAGYNYLVAFYNLWLASNEQYFLADLIIDEAMLMEYRCNFLSALQLTQVQGFVYSTSATFEVKVNRRDPQVDQNIVEFGVLDYSNLLEELVNKSLYESNKDLA